MSAFSHPLLRSFICWIAETLAYRGILPDDVYKSSNVKAQRVKAKNGDSLQREQFAAWFGEHWERH